jgi:hypothetical protein
MNYANPKDFCLSPASEFRRHAAECQRMARSTPDRENKATWKSLAERWLTCADLAERAEEAVLHTSSSGRHIPRAHKRFAH